MTLDQLPPARPHRHRWTRAIYQDADPTPYFVEMQCGVDFCEAVRDPVRSRMGKNNRSRGHSIEREVNAKLGIANVGRFGGPEDGGNSTDWITIQTKSGVAYPERLDRWLRQVPRRAGQMRGLVVADAPGKGKHRRALLIVDLDEAALQWGRG